MKILDWYLLRQTSFMIGIVICSIAGLLLITGIADDAARRVDESYTLLKSVKYNLMMLPSFLHEYIDICVMLGTLITVASLNKNQELTSIQLISSSTANLVLRLLLPALIMLPFLYYSGQWLGPSLAQSAKLERALLTGRSTPTLSGQWFKTGNEYININLITTDNQLIGISRFTTDGEQNLLSAQYSKMASFNEDHWILENSTELNFDTRSVSRETNPQSTWQTELFTPDVVNSLKQYSDRLTLTELFKRSRFDAEAGTLTSETQRDFWNRVWYPIRYCAALLLALAFSFGSFRQKTVGDAAFKTIVIGITAGLMMDTIGAALMILQMNAIAATLLSNLLYLTGSVALLRRSY
ncbi:LptF/LptG family permease [Reinekea thalattae]|nr:LptF/LptG family permease [Reinekea thalattae]